MHSLFMTSQGNEKPKNRLSSLGGFLMRGIGGVRHLLVALLMFPAIHPRLDEYLASEQILGETISQEDLIERHLKKELGVWINVSRETPLAILLILNFYNPELHSRYLSTSREAILGRRVHLVIRI